MNGRHSRDDVIAAALAILDSLGLPDLTMRRLAATLDVQASALYWHFPNKQTLLASVSDRIVARAGNAAAAADAGIAAAADIHGAAGADGATAGVDTAAAPGAGWHHATSVQASALRDALLAYRDGAEVVSSSLALGLGGAAALTGLRAAIALGEFEPRTCDVAAAALLHFILGHVFHEQQRLQADSLSVVAEHHAAAVQHLDLESGAFLDGVALLLNGLEFEFRKSVVGAAGGAE